MSSFLPFFNSEGGPPTGAAGGDLGGSYPNPTVINIEGHPVSATAPTAAQLLIENAGATSAVWVNLSSDVTVSSTGTTTVNSISGSTPIVITPATLQWKNTTASPTINQAAEGSAITGQDLTISPQQSTHSTDQGGGNLIINLQAPTGTGAEAYLNIQRGGVPDISIGNYPAGGSFQGIWLGTSAVGNKSSLYTLLSSNDASDVRLNTTGGGTIGFFAGSSAINVLSSTLFTIQQSTLQWYGGVSSPTINQASISTGSGTNLTIQAQGATGGGNNGGVLTLSSGTSGSATVGSVNIQTGTNNQITISPTTTTFGVAAANTSTVLQVGSTTNLTLTSGLLQWAAGISAPVINQANASSASGQNLAVTAQAGNGSGNNGGNLLLNGGASGGGSGVAGQVQVSSQILLQSIILNDGYGHATTGGNTLTTIYTDSAMAASTGYDFIVTVVGINTSNQDVYRADFSFTYVRVGSGAPALVGASPVALNVRTSGSANSWGGGSIGLATNSVIVQVTGANSTTIDWSCSFNRVKIA